MNKTGYFLGHALAMLLIWNSALAEDSDRKDGGKLIVAPYAWALNMSGTIGLNGIDVPLNLQSTELLSGVKSGGMGYAQWQNERWFLYLEGIFIDFGKKNFAPLFNQSVEASVLFVETGAGLNFDVAKGVRISPYVGARLIKLEVDVKGPLLHQTVKQEWVDPVAGALVQVPLSERFTWVTKADAGGFNVNGNNYQSVATLMVYGINARWSLGAGYRYATFDASGSDGLTMDLEGHGPMGGLQVIF